MTKLRFLLIIAAMLGSTGIACNPKSEQQEAVEAQKQANTEIHEAKVEAKQDTTEIRQDVADKTAEARKDYDKAIADGQDKLNEANADARKTAAEAQAKADEKIGAASETIQAKSTELRTWGKKKIDALNDDIAAARAKAESSKGAALANFESGIQVVEKKRDVIAHDIDTSTAEGSAKIEKLKDSVDKKVDNLKERVDQLSKQL